MELDRSYHPLDVDFIAKSYVPGILGPHDLAALSASRHPRERVYDYAHLFKLRAADKIDPRPQPPRLKDRLRAMAGNARAKAHAKDGHPGFDVAIYLYGRPFIITESDPEAITDLVLSLFANPSEEALVAAFQAQLEYFDIDLARDIAAFVKRRPPQPLPDDKVKKLFAKIFHDRQVLLRDALLFVNRPDTIPKGIAQGAMEEEPDMEQKTRLDPVVRFAHYASHGIGLMLAETQPFWCHHTGVDLAHVVAAAAPDHPAQSHAALLEPLYALLPEARAHASLEIAAHYSAGSMVPAAQVPAVLQRLKESRSGVIALCEDDPRPELLWSKLVEAFTYAARTKSGLIEVADIRVEDQGGMP